MSNSKKTTFAAWFRRGGVLRAETFLAGSAMEAQQIANGTYGTGQFASLAETVRHAHQLGDHFDWSMLERLPLTEAEAEGVTLEDSRQHLLIVSDHARGEALTITASTFPIRVAREAWRTFGDSPNGPATLGQAIADVLHHKDAGVWYSIPQGGVFGAMVAGDAVPDPRLLAERLSCSVSSLRRQLRRALADCEHAHRDPLPIQTEVRLRPSGPRINRPEPVTRDLHQRQRQTRSASPAFTRVCLHERNSPMPFTVTTDEEVLISIGSNLLHEDEPRVTVLVGSPELLGDGFVANLTPDQAEALGVKAFRSAAVARWAARQAGNHEFAKAWKPTNGPAGRRRFIQRFTRLLKLMPF